MVQFISAHVVAGRQHRGFFTVWVVIPLFAVFNAKQCLNALAKPKDDPDHYSAAIADIEKEKGA